MTYTKTKKLLELCDVRLRVVDGQLRAFPHKNITQELRLALKANLEVLIHDLEQPRRRLPLESIVWTPAGIAILEKYMSHQRVRVQITKSGRFKVFRLEDVELIFEPN